MAVKFKKKIMLKKAATTAVTFLGLFVAGVASVQIPDDPAALDAALPGIGIAIAGAAWRAYRNMRKNPEKPGNPLVGTHIPSGYLWPVLAAFAVAGTMAGCVTTTLPDGTVIQRIDDAALREAYAVYERERARREARGENTDELAVYVDGRLWDADAIRDELARYGIELPE